MKTLKIQPSTHKRLNTLKSELEQPNFSDLIDILIYNYCQTHCIQFSNYVGGNKNEK